jgi:hypothetical protein
MFHPFAESYGISRAIETRASERLTQIDIATLALKYLVASRPVSFVKRQPTQAAARNVAVVARHLSIGIRISGPRRHLFRPNRHGRALEACP